MPAGDALTHTTPTPEALDNQPTGQVSSSAASEVTLPWFGLRIIRATQPSAAGGKTAECVAKQSRR